MHTHRFPQPMWNATDTTILFDERMATHLGVKSCDPAGIVYVPNRIAYEALTSGGQSRAWTDKPISLPYPKVLHGPDNQSVSVHNKEQEEAALANGWSLKPHFEETPAELPPSPFRKPKAVQKKAAVKV